MAANQIDDQNQPYRTFLGDWLYSYAQKLNEEELVRVLQRDRSDLSKILPNLKDGVFLCKILELMNPTISTPFDKRSLMSKCIDNWDDVNWNEKVGQHNIRQDKGASTNAVCSLLVYPLTL